MGPSKRSWRCSTCAEHWPLLDECVECPECGGTCWKSINEPDHTEEDVRRMLAYKKFDAFLEERDGRDRRLMELTEPIAFAQYLMDAAEEQLKRGSDTLQE